ncbi:MAG: hypothetical protein AB7D40_10585 [Bacteroidales bacterium]
MRRWMLLVWIGWFVGSGVFDCGAALLFRVVEDEPFPDMKIRMGRNVPFPDVTVKIGEEVVFEDFSVGFTDRWTEADFVITKSKKAHLTVVASSDVMLPDLEIRVGESVPFEDVKIKVRRAGVVDYLIYTERAYISLNEIVVALLPAINQHLGFKLEDIPLMSGQENLDQSMRGRDVDALVRRLKGARIYAQDGSNTFLGEISGSHDSESIFNEFGAYGNEHRSTCIWNEFSTFGSEHSMYSPFNEFSTSPPKIVNGGKVIGYLTVNTMVSDGISPVLLRGLRGKF